MAGDLDTRILNDMEFGRAYFERDGFLDSTGRCEFAPAKKVVQVPAIIRATGTEHDGKVMTLSLPEETWNRLLEASSEWRLTQALIENQRLHALRFRRNRKRYHARVSAA